MIDLKTNQVAHQDIGQMDMYVRMYDELKKQKMITQQLESYFLQIQMQMWQDILY